MPAVGLLGETSSRTLLVGRQPLLDFVRVEIEGVGLGRRHEDDLATGEGDGLVVGGVARVGHDDFVARLDQRLDDEEERLLTAGRDEDLGLRVDLTPLSRASLRAMAWRSSGSPITGAGPVRPSAMASLAAATM